MTSGFIPDSAVLVWLEFTLHTGSEHAGQRPALVIEPRAYNGKAGLALLCPITSRVKGYVPCPRRAEGSFACFGHGCRSSAA
jgi:mRNA interferase MazF